MRGRIGFAILTVAVAAATGAALLWWNPWVQDRVIAWGIRQQLDRGTDFSLDDKAMRVLLCGTGTPMPNRSAAKACVAVAAGGRLFVFDIGPKASENLAIWRIPVEQVEAVFLTHYHSDHIGDLGEFNTQSWAQGRRTPLAVYGPPGVDEVVGGFQQAYALDQGYRHAHHDHGKGTLPLDAGRMEARTVTLPAQADARGVQAVRVYERDGVVITAFGVDHRPVDPAVGYRIEYGGRAVAISGDTRYFPPLAAAAEGVDVLLHEVQSAALMGAVIEAAREKGQGQLADVLGDTGHYHTRPAEAAQIANMAKARLLVFTHFSPPLFNALIERAFMRGVDEVRPDGWRAGRDGLVIDLPVNSDMVATRQIDR